MLSAVCAKLWRIMAESEPIGMVPMCGHASEGIEPKEERGD